MYKYVKYTFGPFLHILKQKIQYILYVNNGYNFFFYHVKFWSKKIKEERKKDNQVKTNDRLDLLE